ncbi:MAG TPA: alpha/beta fold hydrolase [Planctomycetota bacterium]|nr:alpha/beta fold hydrolase [Planctomycetota bacterium]
MRPWRTGNARSRARLVALGLLLVVGGWLGSSLLVVHALTRRSESAPRAVAVPPGCRLLEVETRASDGLRLCAWSLEVPDARGVVLGLHGSGDSRRLWIAMVRPLADRGIAALLPDLRAHGASEGEHNDFGWSARRDVRAWAEWLDVHHPGLPRVVVGHSMGAAATLFAAQEADLGALGYALDACYRDLGTAQRNRLAGHLPGPLDAIAALGMRAVAPLLLDFDVDERTPLAAARALAERGHPPVLVTGALGDPWALPEEQRDLAAALGEPVELVLVEGGGHISTLSRDPEAYAERIARLFAD